MSNKVLSVVDSKVPFGSNDASHPMIPLLGIAFYFAKKVCRRLDDNSQLDEWISCGFLAIARAIADWTPEGGASLGTLAFKYCSQEYFNASKKSRSKFYIVGDGIHSFAYLWSLLSAPKQAIGIDARELRKQGLKDENDTPPKGVRIYFASELAADNDIILENETIEADTPHWEVVEYANYLIVNAKLTTNEGSAVALYVDGMTYREIGDKLGQSKQTAYNWVASGLAKLQAFERSQNIPK